MSTMMLKKKESDRQLKTLSSQSISKSPPTISKSSLLSDKPPKESRVVPRSKSSPKILQLSKASSKKAAFADDVVLTALSARGEAGASAGGGEQQRRQDCQAIEALSAFVATQSKRAAVEVCSFLVDFN
jgi:hypothetical protein